MRKDDESPNSAAGAKEHRAIASAFANCLGHSVLILNVRTRCIDFAANMHMFGAEASHDATAMGFEFFTKHTTSEGFVLLHNLEKWWPSFFETHKDVSQRDCSIACSLTIIVEGVEQLCRATFAPFGFGNGGEIVSVMCTIEPSHGGAQNIVMHNNADGTELVLNDRCQRWEKPQKVELTEQEMRVVQLFEEGKSAKEIAELMCISVHTVNYHKKKLFEKFGVRNMQQVAALLS